MTPAPISVERLRELLDKALDGVTVAPSGCVSFPTETAHLSVSFLAKHGAALLHQLAEERSYAADTAVRVLKAERALRAAERAREEFAHVAPLLLDLATSHECDTLSHDEVSDMRKLAAFLAASGGSNDAV